MKLCKCGYPESIHLLSKEEGVCRIDKVCSAVFTLLESDVFIQNLRYELSASQYVSEEKIRVYLKRAASIRDD